MQNTRLRLAAKQTIFVHSICTINMRIAKTFLFAAILVSMWPTAHAIAAEPAPPKFDLEALAKPPAVFPAEGFDEPEVRALFYEGEPYQGKPTRVFAYYGVPKVASGQKVPAMVLIHGGGGTAFDRWVRVWTARGYAAIAMDLCGCLPVGTYGNWRRHDQGGPPGWDYSFRQLDEPVTDHWPYQAVAVIIRGHSLLRSFPEVDAAKIGMTGISWGGYLTCLTAGVDDRFGFAAPVYGCGFLGDNSAWIPAFTGMGAERAGRWLGQWDPSHYLPQAKMPMLWVNGTNDFAYPMDSWQKSYRLPKSKATLCLRVRMPHAHGPAGENPEEIHAYANALFKGVAALPRVFDEGRDGDGVSVKFESATPLSRAELNYTFDTGKWQERKWETTRAHVDEDNGKVTAKLPAGATVYYINVFQSDLLAVSTQHVVVRP
ncbi:MAG: dipeptidyl aminopeptidase [Planctomycetaceae bacterium]|nr:dipeptidyl aminopeptidase [Planctomycetaceae bacterium]